MSVPLFYFEFLVLYFIFTQGAIATFILFLYRVLSRVLQNDGGGANVRNCAIAIISAMTSMCFHVQYYRKMG